MTILRMDHVVLQVHIICGFFSFYYYALIAGTVLKRDVYGIQYFEIIIISLRNTIYSNQYLPAKFGFIYIEWLSERLRNGFWKWISILTCPWTLENGCRYLDMFVTVLQIENWIVPFPEFNLMISLIL